MFWSNLGRRGMWREMDRLQREMNRLIDSVGRGSTRPSGFPPVNVWANQEHVLVTAELPGVEPEELDISVVAESLTLGGRRRLPQPDGETQWHRHERWHGEFSRTLQLPYRIDAENVEATFRNGVLSVTLPRAEEDRPRRISIGVGDSRAGAPEPLGQMGNLSQSVEPGPGEDEDGEEAEA